MKKKELLSAASAKSGLTKTEVERAYAALVEAMNESFKRSETTTLIGFGTFRVKYRMARAGVNPATGGKITIPAKKVVTFNISKTTLEKIQ